MVTNIIGHSDSRRYNPSRDLSYAWPNLLKATMNRISRDQGCSTFIQLADQYKVTDEDLTKVAVGVANYMRICNNPGDEPTTVLAAMEESGLFACENSARLIVYAALGETVMAAFFSAIRDVLMVDEASPLNDSKLAREVNESIRLVMVSRNKSLLARAIDFVRSYFTGKA